MSPSCSQRLLHHCRAFENVFRHDHPGESRVQEIDLMLPIGFGSRREEMLEFGDGADCHRPITDDLAASGQDLRIAEDANQRAGIREKSDVTHRKLLLSRSSSS